MPTRWTAIELKTPLTTDRLESVFRNAATRMYGVGGKLGNRLRSVIDPLVIASVSRDNSGALFGPGGKLAHARRLRVSSSKGLTYFTPPEDESGGGVGDRTALEAGVAIPTFAGSRKGFVLLYMEVWDRGGHRDVRL